MELPHPSPHNAIPAAAAAAPSNVSPNYSYVFHFEEEFDNVKIRPYIEEYWKMVVFSSIAAYLAMIVFMQWYMRSRPRYEVRALLVVWNVALASFSITGAARTLPGFVLSLQHGIYYSVCDPSFITNDRVSGFWASLFVLSKVPELGDTFFILLRKQPLIFLHWYHHMTVLMYSFFCWSEYTASSRWFIVMNYIVHSVMYSYYACKALRWRVPRSIAMVITFMQISQMIVGLLVNAWTMQSKQNGLPCHVSDENIKASLLMYASYFVLFCKFFYDTYMSKMKNARSASALVPETKIGNGSATSCNGHSNGHASGHAATNGRNGSLRNGRAKKED